MAMVRQALYDLGDSLLTWRVDSLDKSILELDKVAEWASRSIVTSIFGSVIKGRHIPAAKRQRDLLLRDAELRRTLPHLIADPMHHFVELRATLDEIDALEYSHTVYGRLIEHKRGAGLCPTPGVPVEGAPDAAQLVASARVALASVKELAEAKDNIEHGMRNGDDAALSDALRR
jgi:hypothetical protein